MKNFSPLAKIRPLLLSSFLLTVASLQAQSNYNFIGASGSAWQSSADWTSSNGGTTYPVAGDTANFNQNNTAASLISVTLPGSAGTVNFAPTFSGSATNADGYSIGASNATTLTMNNGTSDSTIFQTSGATAASTINSTVSIAGDNVLTVNDNAALGLTFANGSIIKAATTTATTLNLNATVAGSFFNVGGLSDNGVGNLTVNISANLGSSQVSLNSNNAVATGLGGSININQGFVTLASGAGLGVDAAGTQCTIGTATLGASSKATLNVNGKGLSKNFVLYGFGTGYITSSATTTTGDGALENLATGTFAQIIPATAGTDASTTLGSVTLGSNANIYQAASGGLYLGGVVSGAFQLTMGSGTATNTSGSGTLVLSGANTFSGGLLINSGTVDAGVLTGTTTVNPGGASSTALGTGNVTFNATSGSTPTVNLNGNAITVGLLSGTGTNGVVTNAATAATVATLTLSGSGSATYAGAITNGTLSGNTVSLMLTSGTQTLSGSAHTYTGATTISGGTLNITGNISTSSGVGITGGTLTGTGTVPALTLNSTGNITPGTALTATGTLTGASLVFNGGGTLTYLLSSTDNTSSLLKLNGALTLGTAGTYGMNLSGGVAGDTYTLITAGSALPGASNFTDTGSTSGSFSEVGDSLDFTVSTVPEPSTWVGPLLLVPVVIRMLRRRRIAA